MIAHQTCFVSDDKILFSWLMFFGLFEYVEPKFFPKSQKPCHTYPISFIFLDLATGLNKDLADFLKRIAKKSEGITTKGQKLEETI